ncbi:MAG: 50S ribosomal protein L13 [Candidatus Cloacimonetes bacterium]|nr:50S ribosomal protein L13 [Candidatus Cloacimonadota bacterium]MBS3766875.1 50S ribosomal protein L13 [Candidatus Cloacimonadota bacterium]
MKTFFPKKEDIKHDWYLVDAEDKVLGRLATEIARILSGKHKPAYTPHLDMGDYVVVINIDKIITTGNKQEEKIYKTFSGYPGGLKTKTYKQVKGDSPVDILTHAVKGMLPRTKHRKDMMRRLKLFVGKEHNHIAQQPEKLEL